MKFPAERLRVIWHRYQPFPADVIEATAEELPLWLSSAGRISDVTD